MRNGKALFSSLLIICLALSTSIVSAQSDSTSKPCSAPEASQFNFWLGEWDLTWSDSLTRSNIITKELEGCVIHENFSDPTGNFCGRSNSVYNSTKGIWQQTWVDNQGNYMEFEGSFENGKMTLGRSFVGPKGKTVFQRMVFLNITDDSLDWNWQSSLDSGTTWNQRWLIHYKRARE